MKIRRIAEVKEWELMEKWKGGTMREMRDDWGTRAWGIEENGWFSQSVVLRL